MVSGVKPASRNLLNHKPAKMVQTTNSELMRSTASVSARSIHGNDVFVGRLDPERMKYDVSNRCYCYFFPSYLIVFFSICNESLL